MSIAPIVDAELDGAFACPDTDERVPGVLALGGSDGGIPTYFMRMLAAERCACLALAYHGSPKTQPNLIEVPLERPERALRWLRDHPRVAPRDGRVAVVGASKGAELALVLAATFPDLIGPVVAYTPHLNFADAGHALFPVEAGSELKQPMPFDLGGSESAQASAHEVAWPQVLRALKADRL